MNFKILNLNAIY